MSNQVMKQFVETDHDLDEFQRGAETAFKTGTSHARIPAMFISR